MIDVRSATFEELLAAEVCECGVSFDDHPPLRRIRQSTWMAERESKMPWRNTVTGRVLTEVAARAMGAWDQGRRTGIRLCKLASCGKPIPETRARNALYCSDGHMKRGCYDAAQERRRAERLSMAS